MMTDQRGNLTATAKSILDSFLKVRPEVELPAFLAALDGVHGLYVGDGRAERELVLGFQPLFVVFTIPPFPDGPRRYVNGEFYIPPLHEQPKTTERGFKVTKPYNELGLAAAYVAWKPRT
jgi:hypothetical protein